MRFLRVSWVLGVGFLHVCCFVVTDMVGRPFRSNLSMSAMSGQRAQGAQRHEGARERRQRRLRAEARVRYRLCRDAMFLATHRGGPVVGSSSLLPLSTCVQPPGVRDVGGPAGVVSRGCLVGDCAPSLLLPCVVESVPEHDPVLVRYLLSRTLLDRETENKHLEKEKEDGHAVATPPSPVVGTLPGQSGALSSANVVFVTDVSWHEARWNWYRAHAHTSVPDLSQFQAPVVSASSGAFASASMPAALVSQPVQSRFVPASRPRCFAGISSMGSATVATRARLHTRLQNSTVTRITAKFLWQSRLTKTVVPPVMTSASGVDGVRDGVFGPGRGIPVPTLGCFCRQPGAG